MYERGSYVKHCRGCGETKLLFTQLIFNPERMAMFLEKFDKEHTDCWKFRDQKRAQAALKWARALKEMGWQYESNFSTS